MKIVRDDNGMLAAREAKAPGYYKIVKPATTRGDDGVLLIDTEHQAWAAAEQHLAATQRPARSPQQTQRPHRRKVHVPQPGDLLAWMIRRVTGQPPCPMRCADRRRQMNEWGWLGCWRHRDEILTWLADEARRRGHDIGNAKLIGLMKAAIAELRKEPRSGR
ncbi:MAG: hypothetical protein IT445_19660 [Phycisphaeraceae bacterium]|nr:hypothetical protein [Phycisphaeraceae bacterium]